MKSETADNERKERGNFFADSKRSVRESEIQKGDKVLLRLFILDFDYSTPHVCIRSW